MALATSNRAQVRYIKETVFGTTPVAGNPNNLRITAESLAFSLTKDSSKEIRSDRQVTDLVTTSASSSGGVQFELSYNEFDILLEAMMQSTYTAFGTNGVGTAIGTSATFTANTLTAGSAPTGANAFTNLAQGQWIKIAGSTINGQNIWAQVSTSVAPTSTVITFQGSPFTSATGNGGTAVTISTSRISNGTTQTSWTLERALNDVNQFFSYRGMVPSKMNMKFASGAIVTGSMDFVGKDSVRGAVTTLPGTPVASTAYDVMNAVSGVGNILEGGSALTGTFIKSVDLTIDNKPRALSGIGTLGAVGIASGTLEVTGTIEVYLADGTLYDKFLNNTATSLSFNVTDGAGNGYVFTLPKVKYSDAKVQAGGLDQDVMLSLPFRALMDTTTSKTIIIDRAGVAVR